ncbi:MAG: NAD-binding protein [Myxococcales bacterium]|nr:NAD-binding protein [Myxococcales bacterium]
MTYEQLRLLIVAVLSVFVVGTLGYVAIEGMSPFDALYMTVITVTTVGYEEVAKLSDAGRVFTMLLLFVGLGLIFYSITSVTGLVVEGSLRRILGRRAVEQKIRALRGHYIICGGGRMGRTVCEELRKTGKEFVVIDGDESVVGALQSAGFLCMLGDATAEDILEAAGIERAQGLVAALPSDADNVFIVMGARELRADLKIIARASADSSERKLLQAGADRAVLPYRIGGVQTVNALIRPTVVDFIEVAAHPSGLALAFEELRVLPTSKLVGVMLADSGIRDKSGLIIVAIKRGERMIFNPPSTTALMADDVLISFGEKNQLARLDDLVNAS